MTARELRFTSADVREIIGRLYGLHGDVSDLDGYYDQSFVVATASGPSFVFRVSRAGEREDVLDLQNQAMQWVATSDVGFEVPGVVAARDGKVVSAVEGRLVRLLSYVPGEAWSSLGQASPRHLCRLGRLVGSVGVALEGFSHPALDRSLPWELARFPDLRALVAGVEDPGRQALVEAMMDRFDRLVGPRLDELPRSVTHGDINDNNVLVDGTGHITGLIDFEDVSRTTFAVELGVAVAYAMLGQRDPTAAAGHVVRGCEGVRPLLDDERDVVLDLARARLAMSAMFAARARQVDPGNLYTRVNEAAAWSLLEAFDRDDEHY
ncbi:MAG: phosphotransferase [Actinomycetia bacterium]|nr:phosphotransferase [Actinomycetes bacterium]